MKLYYCDSDSDTDWFLTTHKNENPFIYNIYLGNLPAELPDKDYNKKIAQTSQNGNLFSSTNIDICRYPCYNKKLK